MSPQFYHIDALMQYRADFLESENFALAACYFVPFERGTANTPPKLQRNPEQLVKGPSDFKAMCDHAAEMNGNLLIHLATSGYAVTCFTMETAWRFLPGLGSAHIRETGLCLHHIYGLPWLNGSGCKGIARQSMLESLEQDIFEQIKTTAGKNNLPEINLNCIDALVEVGQKAFDPAMADAEKLAGLSAVKTKAGSDCLPSEVCTCIAGNGDIQEKLSDIRSILGRQEESGGIVFMDTVPLRISTTPCIMTPHQKSYYDSKNSTIFPSDADSPNPLPLISVENALYRFSLAAKDSKDGKGRKLLDTAAQYLKTALETVGAGAKSAVDYGYFKNHSDQTDQFRVLAEHALKKKEEEAVTPRQKMESLINSSDFCVHAKGAVRAFNSTNIFSKEERPDLYRGLAQRCLEEIKSLSVLQNPEYDGILAQNLLPGLPQDLKKKLAAGLMKINRFKNHYHDCLSPFLPVRDYNGEARELVRVLSGAPSTADLNKAQNLMKETAIPGEERRKIAEAILKVPFRKGIKQKVLKAARKTGQQYK